VTCMANYCPHRGYRFDGGTVRDGVLMCPVHCYEFRLDTGEGLTSGSPLYMFPIRIRDGRVEVQLERPPPTGQVLGQLAPDAVQARLASSVGYGERISYGALAAAIGRPSASRAVGAALGANPLCVVLPCHRVVAASGAMTGYAGGLDAKRLLLDLEATRA